MSQGHCASADIWGSGTILYQLCFLLRRLVYPKPQNHFHCRTLLEKQSASEELLEMGDDDINVSYLN